MFNRVRTFYAPLLVGLFVAAALSTVHAQDGGAWRVSKSSGDVWVTPTGAQPVALTSDAALNAGDRIRTGQNGRVLLVRGEQSILISANSIVGIPVEKKEGLATIFQQAGSILLEVDKRNTKHFEVETPYLAAVVKGTQFRVSVNRNDARVDVLNGQVEVHDFKTGQYALVNPEQVAKVSVQGGLSLSGAGSISPVLQGAPRKSYVTAAVISNDPPSGSDRAQAAAPQVRMAALSGDASPSSSGVKNESGWASSLFTSAKDMLGFGGRKNKDDDLTFAVTIPIGVGFAVALVIAANRRRQKHKQGQDDR